MPLTVTIDENSGFCFGVINAIRTAENYLKDHPQLYCLGDIVHNNEEVLRLSNLGLRIISYEFFSTLKDTTVLIRAHGEPPHIYDIARENNISLIDATCPVVLKLQKRISEEYSKCPDKQIIIFGKKGHAEVIGLLGQTYNNGIVISSAEDLELVDYQKPAKIYSQTTQNLDKYFEIIRMLKDRFAAVGNPDFLEFEDSICRKVASRAHQIETFAKEYDLVIFVTGEKSSNGLYLSDICKKNNPNTVIVSNSDQLSGIDFSKYSSVGICGATSTPMWLMREIADLCTISSEK